MIISRQNLFACLLLKELKHKEESYLIQRHNTPSAKGFDICTCILRIHAQMFMKIKPVLWLHFCQQPVTVLVKVLRRITLPFQTQILFEFSFHFLLVLFSDLAKIHDWP